MSYIIYTFISIENDNDDDNDDDDDGIWFYVQRYCIDRVVE